LFQEIQNYRPVNRQEEADQKLMLRFMQQHDDCLSRENLIAHFTASVWTVDLTHTKTLLVYHNIYDSWSWIGGHADGEEDLFAVAMRELQEETGIRNAVPVRRDIFSLEALSVIGHEKKGKYVPSHVHLNVTYLAEAEEQEALLVNRAENQAVKWWTFEDALQASKEPWMVERVYRKLIQKCRQELVRRI